MVKLVDTLDSKSNVPWNVWVRVPPSVLHKYMRSLDLHGKNYEDANQLALVFIENNIDNLPVEIITGNSIEMQKIVSKIIDVKGLSGNYRDSFNLGSVIVTEKR